MGFKYKTQVKESTIQGAGKGLFALQHIPKGQLISTFHDQIDDIQVKGYDINQCYHGLRSYTQQQLQTMQIENLPKLKYVLTYGYYHQKAKLFIQFGLPNKFSNHSQNPNTAHLTGQTPEQDTYVALRDIEVGEQILDKYCGQTEYKQIPWVYQLFAKHSKQRIFVMKLVDQEEKKKNEK